MRWCTVNSQCVMKQLQVWFNCVNGSESAERRCRRGLDWRLCELWLRDSQARHWHGLATQVCYQFITCNAPTTLFTPWQEVACVSVNTNLDTELKTSPQRLLAVCQTTNTRSDFTHNTYILQCLPHTKWNSSGCKFDSWPPLRLVNHLSISPSQPGQLSLEAWELKASTAYSTCA